MSLSCGQLKNQKTGVALKNLVHRAHFKLQTQKTL